MKVNEFNLCELVVLCNKILDEYESVFGDECLPHEVHLTLYKVKGDLHAMVSRKENN